jgi:hypothetical protein
MELQEREGFYFCPELDRTFRRIVGALSLPTSAPGAGCVVGEELASGPEAPAFYVLAETEHFNSDELLTWAESVPLDWLVSSSNTEAHNIIWTFNERQIKRHRPQISFMGAPRSDSDAILWHLNVVRQQSDRIVFAEGSTIQAVMEALVQDDDKSFKESLNPAAAVLGHCIAFLAVMPYEAPADEDMGPIPPTLRGADRVTGY